MGPRHGVARAALAACVVLSVAASVATADALSLERAVEIALDDNLSLGASRADYEAAKWGLRSARGSLLPSIRFTSSATRVDPDTYARANASLGFAEELGIEVEPFLYETTYETGFSVTVPIFNGGRLWGAVGASGAARDAAMHAYEAARRRVVVEVKAAYFGVLRTEALHAVARDAAEAAAANVAATRRKLEVGLVSRAELLRWEVALAGDETALAEAENAVYLARTNLSRVLGAPLDATYELEDVTREELDRQHERLAWLLDEGSLSEARARELLAANPDFQSLSDVTRARRSEVTIARGAFLPALNASGSYGWKADDDIDPDDETAWSATLVLDVPVFTGLRHLSDYQESKRSHAAAQRRQEDRERLMVADLRNTATSLKSSLKALHAAEKQLAQSEEHLKNVGNRHTQGLAPYTALVDAHVLRDSARAGYVNALYSSFLVIAETERLLGDEAALTHGD